MIIVAVHSMSVVYRCSIQGTRSLCSLWPVAVTMPTSGGLPQVCSHAGYSLSHVSVCVVCVCTCSCVRQYVFFDVVTLQFAAAGVLGFVP